MMLSLSCDEVEGGKLMGSCNYFMWVAMLYLVVSGSKGRDMHRQRSALNARR